MKKLITAVALTFLMAGSAFANSCPTHIKKIDDALASPPAGVTQEQLAQAKQLRDEGEKLHNEGLHAESMAALATAEELLGLK